MEHSINGTALGDRASKLLSAINEQTNPPKGERVKRTIGERIKIAEYAIAHGCVKAMKEFNVISENQVYKYVRHYREGNYKNIPPDATYGALHQIQQSAREFRD